MSTEARHTLPVAAFAAKDRNELRAAPLADRRILFALAAAVALTVSMGIAGSARAVISPFPAPGFPQASPPAQIDALAVSGNTVYVGGSFTQFGGMARNNVAAFDLQTGQVLPWNPSANGIVESLTVSGGFVYLGGQFTQVGGATRYGLAKVGAGGAGALDLIWNPDVRIGALPAPPSVAAMVASGGNLYFGGDFSQVGGILRTDVASVSMSTGVLNSWTADADAGPTTRVNALALSSGSIYIGGDFSQIGGIGRNNLAKVSAGGSGTVDPVWNPNPNGPVHALMLSGDDLYVGGSFFTVGGTARAAVAKVGATGTGSLDAWNPGGGGTVLTLMASPLSTVYAGGQFTVIGGQPRRNLAEVTAGGPATLWSPAPDSNVGVVTVSGTTVIVGGGFLTFGSGDDAVVRIGLAVFKNVVKPVNTAVPEISGQPEVKQTLSCSTGSWVSEVPLSYAYQWYRDGNPVGQAQTSTYTVGSDDAGSQLTCAIAATNVAGSTSATSVAVTVESVSSPPEGDSGDSKVRFKARLRSSKLGKMLRKRKVYLKVGASGAASCKVKVMTTGIKQIRLTTGSVSFDDAGSKRVTFKVRKSAKRSLRRIIRRRKLKKVQLRLVVTGLSASGTGSDTYRRRGLLRM